MHEFREKKRFRKLLYSNVSIVLLLVLLVLIGKGTWNMYTKQHEAYLDRVDVESSLSSLKSKQDFLTREISGLKTQNGVELEIRDKFNVKRPGEEVAVIVDSTTSIESAASASNLLGERVWGWFVGLFQK